VLAPRKAIVAEIDHLLNSIEFYMMHCHKTLRVPLHQILRYVWKPPSFMRGRKNELAALAAFILTIDRIEGWNKL
jgi:hypothetical protein